VKVASVIEVVRVSTKSSADSISNVEGVPPSGRLAVAIFPSGFPVLKKVVSAAAAAGSKPISAAEIASLACVLDIAFLPATRPYGPRMDGPLADMFMM
jgi:hypothetical protein